MKKILLSALYLFIGVAAYSQQPGSESSQDTLKISADLLKKIEAEPDLRKMEELYKEAAKKYDERDFGLLVFDMTIKFARAGDTKKMMEYYNKVDSFNRKAAYAIAVQSLAGANPKDAEPLLKEMTVSQKPKPKVNGTVKPVFSRNYQTTCAIYTQTLLKNGKDKEAYDYISGLIGEQGMENPILNEAYIQVLLQTRRYAEALPVMEKEVVAMTVSPETKAKFKDVFLKVNGANADFSAYENKLIQGMETSLAAKVAKKAVKVSATDFVLTDLSGHKVALKDLRGKVVVLDFWATWCGPCKASFPGMQKAVNKYKNDPNVKFYFVHTMDKAADPTADARKYIKENNYSFDVLMDFRNKETLSSAVAKSFGIKAIPTKIIIDADGFVRFNTVGAHPDADTAVMELSAMIEFSKKPVLPKS
ncbi:Thiol-disulfide isomerase or thioredoxin [Pedobacter sp. ok626]|uniref:TlpA disulfide reductase family protein n=1 Tax=Pedobacter sp. ok626 TaxID=1761882 RepID=UPI000881C6E4|nr:TlpA disulfide reductase family protein [Pedobacter sp. ok626]SDL54799.1 Thiol-disulfide isomerase or thioredoxin [Pedobacter sp. ok626]